MKVDEIFVCFAYYFSVPGGSKVATAIKIQ